MLDHLLGSTLRGGALLLLAALLGLLCTRRSASLRHLLWALALGQLALLTAVGWLMPVWRWGALPAAPLQLVGPASGEGAPLAPGVTGPGTTALVGASSDGVAASAQAGVDAAAGSGIESAMIWLLLVWAAGALLLLSRCLRSLLAARRLVRGAAPVDDPALLAAAQGARSRLQLVMPFQLRISPAVDTALATGLLHPVVLLPAAARGWSAELLESVLTHELAHIQRRDCALQLLAQVMRAIHWMNPLCWLAHDRLIVERERACDDRVLATGTRPSRYATALLDIAREAVAPRSPLAVAALPVSTSMVRGSALAARLQRVLDPRRSHAVLGRRAIGALAGAALLLALPAACLVGDPADPTPRLRLTYQVAPQHLAETTRVLKRRVDLLNLDGPRIAREGAHLLVDLPAAPEARTAGAWKQSLARSGRLKLVIVESQGDYLDRLTRALAADAGGRAAGLRAHPPTPASEDGRRPGAPGYLQGPGPALERFLAQLPPALAAEPGHRLLVHWDEDLRAHRTIYLDERRQIVLSRFAEAEVRDASDSIGPQWFQVQILLHPEDGAVLDRLTRANLGEQMAVLMDGEQLWGTPTIRAPFGVRVSVTMTGDAAEAERLAAAFRAGALPAPLTLVSEESPR